MWKGAIFPLTGKRTAIENKQNLIVEGCYIPFDWKKDFAKEYLEHIRDYCLVMSEKYIKEHFGDIKFYASAICERISGTYQRLLSCDEREVYKRAFWGYQVLCKCH